MNDMYDMGILTHYYGVIGILMVIFLNAFMLYNTDDIKKYTRFVTLFMPIGMTVIGMVIFSGVVMMAAKHLNFSIENILMILISVALIVLENIRSKILQRLDKKSDFAIALYKIDAYKILALEVFLTLSISIWMLV